MWLAATRVSMAPGSVCSRWTGSPVAATASARVVGMPSACIASPTSTSRSMGPIGGLAVAAAGERRAARSLEGDVASASLPVDHLAEQQRSAIAELRREPAELVARIRLRQRLGAVGQRVAGEHRRARGAVERRDVEAELGRQRAVEVQQPRCGRGRRSPGHVEPLQLAGERIVEAEHGDRRPWS